MLVKYVYSLNIMIGGIVRPIFSYGLTIGISVALLAGYQNCSGTHFTQAPDGVILKAEAINETSTDNRELGDDQQAFDPATDDDRVSSISDDSVVPSPSPTSTPSSNPTPSPTSTPDPDTKKGPKAGASSSQEDLVECQLLHPNKKVVLGSELEGQHSNAFSTRVCMSKNSCLNLINAYAIQHDCSLDASVPAAQEGAEAQCTEIFPGSKGTCHNAAILSDEQMTDLLKKMEEKK